MDMEQLQKEKKEHNNGEVSEGEGEEALGQRRGRR